MLRIDVIPILRVYCLLRSRGATNPRSNSIDMYPAPRKELSLSYELPPAIESIKNGWQRTCEAGAIISSVLAVISVITCALISTTGLLDLEGRDGIRTWLALVSYGSLLFNLSSSVGGFILIDRLGSVPFVAAQKPQETLPAAGYIEGDSNQLLRRYGIGKLWGALVLHWFCCFNMGIWCIVTQVMIFIWLKEDMVVKVCMTVVAVFALLPLFAFAAPVWKVVSRESRGNK